MAQDLQLACINYMATPLPSRYGSQDGLHELTSAIHDIWATVEVKDPSLAVGRRNSL
jgi:hypothetical protein